MGRMKMFGVSIITIVLTVILGKYLFSELVNELTLVFIFTAGVIVFISKILDFYIHSLLIQGVRTLDKNFNRNSIPLYLRFIVDVLIEISFSLLLFLYGISFNIGGIVQKYPLLNEIESCSLVNGSFVSLGLAVIIYVVYGYINSLMKSKN